MKKRGTRAFTLLQNNKKYSKSKRSQSQLIVTVLLILLVLAAIVIVYNVFNKVVKEKSSEVSVEPFKTSLDIQAVVFDGQTASVDVHRGIGKAEILGLKFIFYDSLGITHIVETSDTSCIPNELETKTCSVVGISDEVITIEKVSVVPIFEKGVGVENK